jgi:hypothetical protein
VVCGDCRFSYRYLYLVFFAGHGSKERGTMRRNSVFTYDMDYILKKFEKTPCVVCEKLFPLPLLNEHDICEKCGEKFVCCPECGSVVPIWQDFSMFGLHCDRCEEDEEL